MMSELIAGARARPESEVEWEDLLLRMEVMPRALRVSLERVDADESEVEAVLEGLAARERFASDFLAHASGTPARTRHQVAAGPLGTRALEHFVRLRARNFAMVQRRGIDVWEWSATLPDGRTATVHQLLFALVGEDVRALAELRRFSGTGSGVC